MIAGWSRPLSSGQAALNGPRGDFDDRYGGCHAPWTTLAAAAVAVSRRRRPCRRSCGERRVCVPSPLHLPRTSSLVLNDVATQRRRGEQRRWCDYLSLFLSLSVSQRECRWREVNEVSFITKTEKYETRRSEAQQPIAVFGGIERLGFSE